MIARALTLSALVLGMISPAFADPTPPPSGGMTTLRTACKADIETYCKDVQPGGGRIRDCLKANRDKLSQSCKDAAAQAKAHHETAPATPPAAPQ
jgi:hypothetical protein